MTLAAVVLYLAPVFSPVLAPVLAPSDIEEARAHVAALEGAGRNAALDALTATEPEFAVRALVECLAEAPTEHAWQAMRALRRVAREAGTKDRAFADAAKALARVVGDDELPLERREVAALACAQLGERGKSAVEPLEDALAERAAPALEIAAAYGLSGLADLSRKRLEKLLTKKDVQQACFALLALGAAGEGAAKSGKALRKAIVREDDFVASVLSSAMMQVAKVVGVPAKQLDEAWEDRQKHEKGKTWFQKGASVNYGGVLPKDLSAAMSFLRAQGFKLSLSIPLKDVSMPTGVEDGLGGSYFTLADFLRRLYEHVVTDLIVAHGELASDSFATHAEWRARIRSLLGTCELCATLAPLPR